MYILTGQGARLISSSSTTASKISHISFYSLPFYQPMATDARLSLNDFKNT